MIEGLRWYVVQVKVGHENLVCKDIEDKIIRENLSDLIKRVVVPTQEIVEIKEGVKKVSYRKFFPGYVLLQMELTEDTWYFIRRIPKVTGFVGGSNRKPVPITDEEVEKIFAQIKDGAENPKYKNEFEVGESVRIKDGPFIGFHGAVSEVNYERNRIKASVSIFGRATPIELDFVQVERI